MCTKGAFISTIALDAMASTVASFENLSTHVRKRVPSVEKISTCRISPTNEGVGLSAAACLDGCRLYFAIEHVLQFEVISVAKRSIFWKK